MVREKENAVHMLRELQSHGILIGIDDFGIGYSSLSYLRFLPVDILKIDRSFITSRSEDDAITATIANLATSLGVVAIAEGIEQPGQWDRLRAMGCQLGQGYLIAKPMSARDVMSYIEAGSAGKARGLAPPGARAEPPSHSAAVV